MTDILIRDVPEDVVSALDAQAKRQGLSRNEYLRRQLALDVQRTGRTTVEDLEWFAETFADLRDPEVMRRAWE